MREIIKITHDGVEIVYHENTNQWKFELRGRERSVESLAKAKEVIDKPEPKEKIPFDRTPAWMRGGYGNRSSWVKVTVTSVAIQGYGSPKVWVTKGDNTRSQEYSENIVLDMPENVEKIEYWKALQERIDKLAAEQEVTWKSMKKVEVKNG